MKIFLLGLDGMTFKVVEPLVKAGVLPNFSRIMGKGASGILQSTIPPLTPPAWTTLATGKNPGKHGIYEFRRKKGYQTEFITGNTSEHAESFWSILSRHGKRVAVVNVPFTYPPDKVNGIMISGMMTPGVDSEFVYPREMKDELLNVVPNYRFDVDQTEIMKFRDSGKLIKEILSITEDVRTVMDHLMAKESWDLFYVTFIGSDRLQHFLWNEIMSMEPDCVKYYSLLDEILGDILNKIDDDTTLLVVSDHGFMEVRKGFHFNNFIRDLGLLNLRGSMAMKKSLSSLSLTSETINNLLNRTGLLNLKERLPSGVIDLIRKFLPVGGVKEGDVDWSQTKVFSLSYGVVFINLKGREPQGTVEKDEYDGLCQKVKEELLKIKDPETGGNVIKAVHFGSEIYAGDYDEGRPDLVFLTNEGYSIWEELSDNILSKNRLGTLNITGYHDIDGIYAAFGKHITSKSMRADIQDIMPTILYLLETPIPEDVDGRILKEIIDDDFLSRHDARYEKVTTIDENRESSLSDEEKDEIERKLKNLGYLS